MPCIDEGCSKQPILLEATFISGGMKRYGGHDHNYKLENGELGVVDLIPGIARTHADDTEEETRPVDPHNDAFEQVQNRDDVLPRDLRG
jgi:hypothetical protein